MSADLMLPFDNTDAPARCGDEPAVARAGSARATAGARWHDSAESWDAPPTAAERDRVRLWVLGAVHRHGPITDDALLDLALREGIVSAPTSSVRSRRNELTIDGSVRLADKCGVTSSGRRAARWSTTTSEATG